MAWELKKVLISQKGLVVFALLVYLAFSASMESNYMDFRSRYVTHWYEDYAGKIDEEKTTLKLGIRSSASLTLIIADIRFTRD